MKHYAKWQEFLLTVDNPDAVMHECRTAMVHKLWGMDGYTYAQQQKLLIPWQEQYMKDHVSSMKDKHPRYNRGKGFRTR